MRLDSLQCKCPVYRMLHFLYFVFSREQSDDGSKPESLIIARKLPTRRRCPTIRFKVNWEWYLTEIFCSHFTNIKNYRPSSFAFADKKLVTVTMIDYLEYVQNFIVITMQLLPALNEGFCFLIINSSRYKIQILIPT